MEILTPEHELWHTFMVALTGPEWLDFQLISSVSEATPYFQAGYTIRDGIAWFCEESKHKPFAREVLREMGSVDVEATLAQWPDLCDCRLVFELGNGDEEEE